MGVLMPDVESLTGVYCAEVVPSPTHGVDGVIWVMIPSILPWPNGAPAKPCLPFASAGFGFAFVPPPGSRVWIAFEGGQRSNPVWLGSPWPALSTANQPSPGVTPVGVLWGPSFRIEFSSTGVSLTCDTGTTVAVSPTTITIHATNLLRVEGNPVHINDNALVVT